MDGYTPVFAVCHTGTEGMYDWISVNVTSAGCMILVNEFTGSVTTDITIRIWYMKF